MGKSDSREMLDSIVDTLVETQPEVQEHAVEQERQRAESYAHLKDSDGRSFDPSIHKTDADGEPVVTKRGTLAKKPGRRGGPTGSRVARRAKSDTSDTSKEQARAAGVAAAHLTIQLGVVLGGDEWLPRRDPEAGLDEQATLERAFGTYFEATGKTDIPPGIALAVALGAYALPRFAMPKTKTRIGRLKSAVKAWWVKRKLKGAAQSVREDGAEKRPAEV